MRSKVLLMLVVVAACAVPLTAQKFLAKPYTEWNKDEALKILNESPWARVYSSTAAAASADAQNAARARADSVNRGGGRPGSVSTTLGTLPVTLRVHSSPYVRQAMVRLEQIAIKYDKMDESKKAAFDASKKGYLDCAICKDYYVFTLQRATDSSGETVNEGMFAAIKPEQIIGKISIVNDLGERRSLIQFNPAKSANDSAVFYFKRTDDNGKPLIDESTKEIEFVFSGDFVQSDKRYSGQYPRRFDFSVQKMVVDGKVSF